MDHLIAQLGELDREGLRRRTVAWPDTGGKIRLPDGRTLLNFSSNDYLNLAHHPQVKEQSIRAVERWGCSASASRLMCGTLELHEELESALAHLVGSETSLVFSSGFGMNVGVVAALANRDDEIFADRLIHASLVDGARLSGARLRRFAHNDAKALEHLLAAPAGTGHRLIVCESVYSMDGDIAPLGALQALASASQATLLVDQAHAIGVFGEGGGVRGGEAGAGAHAGRGRELTVGTLGKALGSLGGFVGCCAAMREVLINRARSFIYATALAPANVAAALAAVKLIEENPAQGQQLLDRARAFHGFLARQGLALSPFQSQIVPIHVGDNARAVELAARLRQRDLLVTAIRPPTVPAGTARLRLSLTLAHSTADLEAAAECIGRTAREVGLQ